MSKEIISFGNDFVLEWVDRAYAGARRNVMVVDGLDGSLAMGGLSISASGDVSIAGASISGGAITADTVVSSGKDLSAAGGASDIDWHLSSGIFQTPTGQTTLNGAVALASGKDIVFAGGASDLDMSLSSGVFKTPTGTATFAGLMNLASGVDIVALGGASDFDFSLSSGIWKGPSGTNTFAGKIAAAAAAWTIADPGGANAAIPVTTSGVLMITTAGAETNTLAVPTFVGQELSLIMDTHVGGDRVVTSAQSINQTGNTIMTFGAAADMIVLKAMKVAGALRWRVVANDGVALS